MDVDYNIREAEYALKHLHDWVKPVCESAPWLMEPGHVRVRRDPFGVSLIIGAWNEPYMLRSGAGSNRRPSAFQVSFPGIGTRA